MNDTHPIIEKEFRKRLIALPPEIRMEIASHMFGVCRDMILASFSKILTGVELKLSLFERIYAHDFTEKQQQEIIRYIKHEKHSRNRVE